MIKQILRNLNEWQDAEGYVHHTKYPRIRSSENRVLFTQQVINLATLLGVHRFAYSINNPTSEWYRYLADKSHLSHDNATAIASYCAMTGIESPVPIFSLSRPHPRDIIFYALAKKKLWAYPLMPLLSIIMMISCAKKYKYRNGQRFNVTDGKLLAFIRMHSLKMNLTFKICTYLIKKNPVFGSWTAVAKTYFQVEGHPIPQLMELYESTLRA